MVVVVACVFFFVGRRWSRGRPFRARVPLAAKPASLLHRRRGQGGAPPARRGPRRARCARHDSISLPAKCVPLSRHLGARLPPRTPPPRRDRGPPGCRRGVDTGPRDVWGAATPPERARARPVVAGVSQLPRRRAAPPFRPAPQPTARRRPSPDRRSRKGGWSPRGGGAGGRQRRDPPFFFVSAPKHRRARSVTLPRSPCLSPSKHTRFPPPTRPPTPG